MSAGDCRQRGPWAGWPWRALALGLAWSGSAAGAWAQSSEAAPTPAMVMPDLPAPPSEYSTNPRDNYSSETRAPSIDGGFEALSPQKIYFPPNPPPLGVEIMPGATAQDRRALAPAELAQFVLEPFYAPLSTRFGERTFNRRHEEFLTQHRTLKAALLDELRAQLDRVLRADPETRLRELEAFARGQTPRIAEWEAKADTFRRQLYSTGLLSDGTGDWYAMRTWKLGRGSLDKPREETRYLEFQVVRAAAFYQDGLAPAQRRLLREVAMEMEEEIFDRHGDTTTAARDWFSFFSPDQARVHWPEELPASLKAQLQIYQEEKAALKRELRDAIYENDKAMFEGARNRALTELARQQAGRIASLEGLAEDIRRELRRHPVNVAGTVPPPLPAALEERIATYQDEKRILQRDLSSRVRAALRVLPPPDPQASPETMRDWNGRRSDIAEGETAQFEADNADRLRALDAQLEAIRAEIEALAGVEATIGTGLGFDSFLTEFLTRRSQQSSNREYHLAVLEPGLSPEQRRLLFDAAITALNLPLPGPETQATMAPGTMLK